MSDASNFATKTLVLTLDGMNDVDVQNNLPFGDGLSFDLYRPKGDEICAAVIYASGYPESLLASIVGRRPREMGLATSWGRLVAASGMAAIVYGAREPIADLGTLIAHLRVHGANLGLDATRLAVWAASGNAPTAFAYLNAFQAAVLCNPYMIDPSVKANLDAAHVFGFAVPDTLGALPTVPLYVVRSGEDATPGLNLALDRFVGAALAADQSLEFVNLPGAPHAFELLDPRPSARSALARAFTFLAEHLKR